MKQKSYYKTSAVIILFVMFVMALTAMLMLGACGSKDTSASGGSTSGSGASTSNPSDGTSSNSNAASGTSNTDAKGAYLSVLQGNTKFFSADVGQDLSLSQINQAVSADSSVTATVTKFAVIDLDRDGVQECVLKLKVNNDEDYGFMVLGYRSGKVYGYAFVYRVFNQVKADGTFSFSSGAADSGFGTISLNDTGFTMKQVTYSVSTTAADGSVSIAYNVAQKASDKAAFDAAMAEQAAKPDVIWYSLTEGVAKAVLS